MSEDDIFGRVIGGRAGGHARRRAVQLPDSLSPESVALIAKAVTIIRGIVTLRDRDLRLVLVSEHLLQHFDLDPDAIVGRTLPELLPGQPGVLEADELSRRVLETGEPVETYELPFEPRPGSGKVPMWIRGTKLPIFDTAGACTHVLTVGIDITDLRTAEQSARELALRDAAIISGALDCIVTIDDAGRIIEWNAAAEATFGWQRLEALGANIDELIIPRRHKTAHRQGMHRIVHTGEARMVGRRVELDAVHADGHEFPVELAVIRVDRKGRPTFTAFLRDLTARRAAEARIRAAERERAQLSRFFAPGMVEEMLALDVPLSLARKQTAAVLFADMIGFTSMAADMAPEAVIDLLRAWHGRLTEAVFRHRGTIDKFIGDGIMATFGVPKASPSDAADAVGCALDMVRAVEDLSRERIADGRAPLSIAIGINHGEVVVGDIGTAQRLELTVVGDVVNVASRIEGLCRDFATPLLISDAVVQRLGATGAAQLARAFEDLGPQSMRGHSARPRIHRLARPD